MTRLVCRPIDTWPGALTAYRETTPFSATWTDTVDVLAREVEMLTPGQDPEVVLQLAVTERDIRRDGWVRADARPTHPGVIVSFQSRHGPLRYHTDRFLNWQSNVRAIALGLEALRKVDRYGISTDGEQYRGWQALPAGPAPERPMTVEEAARFLARHGGPWNELGPRDDQVSSLAQCVLRDNSAAAVKGLYKNASRRLHPDAGGDPADFLRLKQASDLLERHMQGPGR